MIYFFTVEWTLRVLCFEPAPGIRRKGSGYYIQWLSYLTDTTTVLDALAIFPYYLEEFTKVNGLLSLRLLRLFRVFQLVRLGQYNVTFISLTNVLVQSVLSFNLLLIVLIFGATFFGSIIFWLEKGEWTYSDYTDPPRYMYIRTAADGISQEPSPFTSIPASFWWFIVTATTVGYGGTKLDLHII
jgi:voltage-gated potassium channel